MSERECPSNIHEKPVLGTVHGVYGPPGDPFGTNQRVWYCDKCAATGEAIGLFTPDKP